MDSQEKYRKRYETIAIITILVIIAFWKYEVVLIALKFLFGIISPFVLGAALAFVLKVPMNFFERTLFQSKKLKNNKLSRRFSRPLSLVLTLISVVGVIALVLFVVIPQLANSLVMLSHSIQVSIPKVQAWFEELFQNNEDIVTYIQSIEFNWEKIVQTGVNFFKTGASNILDTSFALAKGIVSGLTSFFIGFVFAMYILLQKEKLQRQCTMICTALLPKRMSSGVLNVCSLANKTFSNFLAGQCVEAVILGSMFVLSMSILRLPYAVLVGVLIAFTALIPVFGAFIGCVIGTFLILMVSPVQALIFVILFLVLQQLEGNFIYPHVVGNSVGLPSIWVLVAVSLGASLMGVIGMLIFIPLTSVFYTLFREYIYKKLSEKS